MTAAKVPTVSVIVPVYNGEDIIGRCIESLLELNYPSGCVDIIVVENGSTDRTTDIVQQYPVRLLHSPQRGPAAARNFGVQASEADIVAFTDADCIAHPNWLSELVKPYSDLQVGGVGGWIQAYQHGDRNSVEIFSDEFSPLVNFLSGENEFLPHLYTANASYRRDLVNQVGGFDPALFSAEDVDLAWRVQLKTGCELRFADESIIFHHHRTTLKALGRQYRQYGFGEILLDTMYRKYPNYPRSRSVQMRRMLDQSAALVRYLGSIAVRQYRHARGLIDDHARLTPRFWLRIEYNNILGKLEGLVVTRFMSHTKSIHQGDSKTEMYIERFY